MKPNSKAGQAAVLVLEKGMSRNAAARQLGICPSAVSRAVQIRTSLVTCPCCGHVKREVKRS